jgi:hypothetical protein
MATAQAPVFWRTPFFGSLPAFAAGGPGASEVSGFVLFIPDYRPVPRAF